MIALRRGDVVAQRSAGGGGYGDPKRRAAVKVLEDVRLGYVSREAAARDYGVVVTDGQTVDEVATRHLRAGAQDGSGLTSHGHHEEDQT